MALDKWPFCCYCEQPIVSPPALPSFNARFCKACKDGRKKATDYARWLVSQAIIDMVLLRPEKLQCIDCGAAAKLYEHRSYNKPLEVEPMCVSCNTLRGPAEWDKDKPVTLQSVLITQNTRERFSKKIR